MPDPKHPPKLVIKIKGGLVEEVYIDKSDYPLRVFIAEYDCLGQEHRESFGFDMRGGERLLSEIKPLLDTMEIRNIQNKKWGGLLKAEWEAKHGES